MSLPVLYSFRRCPYAIRTRVTLCYSGQEVELREVSLRDVPAPMREASPKSTVPVLVSKDGKVLEESLDIMHWALERSDPEGWNQSDISEHAARWIKENDEGFKPWLDRYKYAERHPEFAREDSREQASAFIFKIAAQLEQTPFLLGGSCGIADIALFPFVRQYAMVQPDWFEQSHPSHLKVWLAQFLDSSLFATVMHKYAVWQEGTPGCKFPPEQMLSKQAAS